MRSVLLIAILASVVEAGGPAKRPPVSAKPKPRPLAACRAVDLADRSKVLAEAKDVEPGPCAQELQRRVFARFCKDPANQGKVIRYHLTFDHVIPYGDGAAKYTEYDALTRCARGG
ncbi:hypothetical protein BH11MYX3_BH11MYX3_42690 [soil metagenome]